ncbi:MAG TPA: hypothetical protein VLW44_13865 [Streptosporangiaceae bacterium]|nr:hypothetical protein [Streptosporangiaceae bacterium]
MPRASSRRSARAAAVCDVTSPSRAFARASSWSRAPATSPSLPASPASPASPACAPSRRSRSSRRRSASCAVTSRSREARSSASLAISCSASPTLRSTSPACAARLPTSFSSVGVNASPRFFVTDSAPSSSPSWVTGTIRSPPGTAGSAAPASTRAGRDPASAGHQASSVSSPPDRSHTSVRTAPVASAMILAMVGSSSPVA